MSENRRPLPPSAAFIGIGIAFMVLGATSQPAFLGVGVVFLVIGLGALHKHRRGPV